MMHAFVSVIPSNINFWMTLLDFVSDVQVVYILDQVRALEEEMLTRIRKQGLDVTPRILIVSMFAN